MIAVTGAGGFIGRAVTAELRGRGSEVTGLDLPAFDVRRPVTLPGGTSHVIHLAGLLGTSELACRDVAAEAVATNITGTVHVLDAARAAGAGYTGITMPDVFASVYTATKVGAARMERAWHHGHGVPVSRVRAFNAYGPWQRCGPGSPAKIVPVFARAAWAGKPIPVYGTGEQSVDLIWVGDLARLLADAVCFDDDVTIDGGTGAPLTVNSVACMVLDITGSRAGISYLPMRRGETPSAAVAARGEGWDRLTWRPRFEPDRFEETVRWYRRRLGGGG